MTFVAGDPKADTIALEEQHLELLRLLKESPDYLSGELLAARFGVTRAGLWKWIERLRALGIPVEGGSRRGYRLGAIDLLLPQEILAGLPTRYLTGPVHYFLRLSSTNDLAKDLAQRDAPEGTVLVAETQTAGRGRLGRQWLSPPGTGLYFSVILRPPLPPATLPKLTLLAAVATVAAIKGATGIETQIKWPNDILLNGRKVGGILTETEAELDQVRHVILGIGLNVNTTEFPEPLAASATSLAASGRTYPRAPLLRALLVALDEFYGQFLARNHEPMLAAWRRAAATLGQRVEIRQGQRRLVGLAVDITEEGALLLQQADGTLMPVVAGEIVAGLPPIPNAGSALDRLNNITGKGISRPRSRKIF